MCFFISIKQLKTLEELHNKIDKRILYVLNIQNNQVLIFFIIIFEVAVIKKAARQHMQIRYKLY